MQKNASIKIKYLKKLAYYAFIMYNYENRGAGKEIRRIKTVKQAFLLKTTKIVSELFFINAIALLVENK